MPGPLYKRASFELCSLVKEELNLASFCCRSFSFSFSFLPHFTILVLFPRLFLFQVFVGR